MDRSVLSSGLTAMHVCALVLIFGWAMWPVRRDWGAALCALFILIWTNVVCTSLTLASASRLGDRIAFVGLSISLGVVLSLFLRQSLSRSETPPAAPPSNVTSGDACRSAPIARVCFGLVILVSLIVTAALCFGVAPNNFDSVAYRLPRAFLYIGQGSLSQLAGGDFRMKFYPFDTTLAYVAFAIHGLAGSWMNVLGFASWLIGGIAVERTAREIGAGRSASRYSATLYMTAPAVLVSASSSNDDMIAGVPLLIGLLFALRWWRSVNLADAALAGMGFGLSAGSKLHLPFVLPVAALFCVVFAMRLAFQGRLLAALRGRKWHTALVLGIVALLAVPAFAINIEESGRATPALDNYENVPFSSTVAGVNTALFSANLFLSPIPDLDLDPSKDDRKALYDAFNGWLNQHIFYWVSPTLNYSNEPYYRFEGVASSDAYWGVWEQSAWLGFTPWLLAALPVAAWLSGRHPHTPVQARLRTAALWLTAAFFGWHLTRCFVLKYIGAAGIYYAFIMVLAAPAAAWMWQLGATTKRGRTVVKAFCLAVLAGNLVSAVNAWEYNVQRNLPDLLANAMRRPRSPLVGPVLAASLQASKRTLIAYTQWEEPLFDLISVQPKARYGLTGGVLPSGAVPGYDLSFMLARMRSEYGEVPLQFGHDDRKRLSVLGTMTSVFGGQRAFGHGELPPQPDASTVAEYSAASDGGTLSLVGGWSPTEHTHRWSDGASSALDFVLPAEETACVLDVTAISLGRQHVTATLNGEVAGAFDLDSWFPGKDLAITLPDESLIPGHTNHLVLGYDAPQRPDGESRTLALGLVKAAVVCRPGGGPDRRVIFDYQSSSDAGSASLTQGWSSTERTHRWSDAAESDIDFRLPLGKRTCALNGTAITAGHQTISTSLNGVPVAKIELESWFPGRDFHIDFPDEDLHPGAANHIAFHFAAPQTVQGRALALGLVSASIRCRVDDTAATDRPPSTQDGFAVLELDQKRDTHGALTAVSPGRLNGVDADEAFDIDVSLMSPAGEVKSVSNWAPIRWSTWIDLPSAPNNGAIHVQLRRRDRPDIAASVYMPVAAGQELGLDLGSPPLETGTPF